MSYDVVVAGPPFLDLSFLGLARLPRLGEELEATELMLGPGGAAITAIAASRLGLRSAVAWSCGTDQAGRWLADALLREGVDWIGPETAATAVTAVMALDGERAMVTHRPPVPAELSPLPRSRAWVTAVSRADRAPSGARVYAVVDDAESRHDPGEALGPAAGARALLVNEAEARRLTATVDSADNVSTAAVRLAERTGAQTVVVTCGADGAVAVEQDRPLVAIPGVITPVVDTTGAGDVFAATYVWADLGGLGLPERLALSVLAGALAVSVGAGAAGAPLRAELARQARAHGVTLPQSPA